MKYGVILPPGSEQDAYDESLGSRMAAGFAAWRRFIIVVIAPTLIVAAYYYLFASDQYMSETHFIVKSGNDKSTSSPAFGQLLGLTDGGSQSQSEVTSVSDYLQSHDAVAALQSKMNLVAVFRRPGVDFISRLWTSAPTSESLLKYYRGKVQVRYDRDTGITDLTVKAFRPEDAYAIARVLITLGEQRVNAMNRRTYNDAVSLARQNLGDSERLVADVQKRLTGFRQQESDIDPESSGQAQLKLVSGLNSNLAEASAQLSAMGATLSHNSPQYVALAHQVASLKREIAAQSDKLTGSSSAIAGSLEGYEDLKIRQEFASKRYEAAAAAFDKAREDAARQQLYVIRVVEPNMPQKSLYPERLKVVLTVFFGLLLSYGIIWLIAAGVREHEA